MALVVFFGAISHVHEWTAVYKTVHHEAITHTEEKPVYEKFYYELGLYCLTHMKKHVLLEEYKADFDRLGCCSSDKKCIDACTTIGPYEKTYKVQTGSEQVIIIDKEAYDEQYTLPLLM